jgi:hypothetical protein
MKLNLIPILVLLTVCFAYGQGTFVYDQQSTNQIEGAAGLDPSNQPMGQSFTPSLSSIGFVQLSLYDGDIFNNLGSTVYVNLRSNSITGTILGSSLPVFMPDSFLNITNFIFSTPIAVVPGVIYYLQPTIQSGSQGWGSMVTDSSYTGGIAFIEGSAWPGHNLWFREGVIAVPEPSSALLVLLGSGAWLFIRRKT